MVNTDFHSTLGLLLGVGQHLTLRRKVQLILLLVVFLVNTLAEMLSLSAVIPLLATLSNPQAVLDNKYAQSFIDFIDINSSTDLIVFVVFIFVVLTMLSTAVRIVNSFSSSRLAAAITSDLSVQLFNHVLSQSYEVHLLRNSSSVITAVVNRTAETVVAINAAFGIVASLMISLGLIIVLMVANWPITLITVSLVTIAYAILVKSMRLKLAANGNLVVNASSQQIKYLQEGLGSIRDVLIDGTKSVYTSSFREADIALRRKQSENGFLSSLPRYLIEGLAMIILALIAGVLSLNTPYRDSLIPILGTIALGSQRLLPSFQQVFNGWASIRACRSGLAVLLEYLNQPISEYDTSVIGQSFQFDSAIELRSIYFKYQRTAKYALNDINLLIKKGECLGIIGNTGSGKSTMVDILMGLLLPSLGELLIDGQVVCSSTQVNCLRHWHSMIAHVPQSIYLTDGSITENIAFGISKQDIDLERVRLAAESAQISAFVESFPEGYDTSVGERGVRLSGGQRQRIGIARALYKQAQLLVLDEATSALDTSTEKLVMSSIHRMATNMTIIMIAHRLSSLQACDRILLLEDGRIKRQGTPQDLL